MLNKTCSAIIGFLLGLAALSTLPSCEKWTDTPGAGDSALVRRYCNDPQAVNYNWDFPGTPDNSVCFYPADVFAGRYAYTDSATNGAGTQTSVQQYTVRLFALSRTRLGAVGLYCPTDTLYLSANRFFRATFDSTTLLGIPLPCLPSDTLSGSISRNIADTTRATIFSTTYTPSGVFQHRGTAVRIP